MKLMEQFNRRLNSSVEVKNKSDFSFRNQVDSILQELIHSMNNKENLCIIGAGQCREFSLPIFMDAFDHVLITDIDSKTVLETIDIASNLIFKQVEYTGFEEGSFFKDFNDLITKTHTTKQIDEIINKKLQVIENYKFLNEDYGSMDLVYISPIYSQLVYQQVLLECNKLRLSMFSEHLIKHIESVMLDKMIGVINRFNINATLLLRENGYLIVLSDIFELEHGSAFHSKVSKEIRSKDGMEQIHTEYVNNYGMGLGDYGLYNLDKLVHEIKSEWLLWKFTEKRSYAVKLKIYNKSDIEGGIL